MSGVALTAAVVALGALVLVGAHAIEEWTHDRPVLSGHGWWRVGEAVVVGAGVLLAAALGATLAVGAVAVAALFDLLD